MFNSLFIKTEFLAPYCILSQDNFNLTAYIQLLSEDNIAIILYK